MTKVHSPLCGRTLAETAGAATSAAPVGLRRELGAGRVGPRVELLALVILPLCFIFLIEFFLKLEAQNQAGNDIKSPKTKATFFYSSHLFLKVATEFQ